MTNHVYKQNYGTGDLIKIAPIKFDLSHEWYVFIAWGPLSGGTHVFLPYILLLIFYIFFEINV